MHTMLFLFENQVCDLQVPASVVAHTNLHFLCTELFTNTLASKQKQDRANSLLHTLYTRGSHVSRPQVEVTAIKVSFYFFKKIKLTKFQPIAECNQ